MVLVSDILEHIGRIYSPLNLANMKIQKLKFVRNTASAGDWRIFMFVEESKNLMFLSKNQKSVKSYVPGHPALKISQSQLGGFKIRFRVCI